MIQIIKGTFGHRNGNAIEAKTAKSKPFETAPDIEERLIKKGVAIRIEKECEPKPETKKNEVNEERSEMSESDMKQTSEESETPFYSETNTVKELKEICVRHGIELPKVVNKSEILIAMDAALKNDAPPTINAMEAIK